MAYGLKTLGLSTWENGKLLASMPLLALGIGVAAGCLLAGKLSGAKVEYGLLPLGALGLTLSTLAFAVVGPGLTGSIVLMALLGIFSGFLFVPLNALLQWRSPADRRGAMISMANVLVYAGMLSRLRAGVGSGPRRGFGAGTFLGASIALGFSTIWALWLVPDAFIRFILLGLAHTLYRVRIIGRTNVPPVGGALLVPNHVSFADGLFIIASTDRPVRFVVYGDFFERPFIGWVLRSLKAIPISPSGGPKMILQAFREAGRALDNGELVCLFPEGQTHANGPDGPISAWARAHRQGPDQPDHSRSS